MPNQFIALGCHHFLLQLLDLVVVKLNNRAGLGTYHVVMMLTPVDLKERLSTLKIVAQYKIRLLELGQHSVDSSQSSLLSFLQKPLVYVLRAQVSIFGIFEQFKDFYTRHGDLEACLAQFAIFVAHMRLLLKLGFKYYARYAIEWNPQMNYKALLLVIFLPLLTSCSDFAFFPGIHTVDVQQGNIINQSMVDQLKPGMSKAQVRFVLGTPLIADTFDQDRWDYFYSLEDSDEEVSTVQFSVFFFDDQLDSFEGNLAPLSQDGG